MKKINIFVILIAIIIIIIITNAFIYYQYKHIYYKYYWNRLLHKSQTFFLDQNFKLETGVEAKLENTDYSFVFIDHLQKDFSEKAHCIDCNKDYYDDYQINNGNNLYKFQKIDCETNQVTKFITKNSDGKRCFVFKIKNNAK